MKSVERFGKTSVEVKEAVFFVNKTVVQALREWYENKLKVDPEAPEEAIEDELEYLTKALITLRPRTREEAERMVEILEQAYETSDCKVTELFDKLFDALED